jgi:hypothetical protein
MQLSESGARISRFRLDHNILNPIYLYLIRSAAEIALSRPRGLDGKPITPRMGGYPPGGAGQARSTEREENGSQRETINPMVVAVAREIVAKGRLRFL